jgi:SAM-dependent methyltransferase
MSKEKYTDINARAVDSWVNNGWEWGKPITHDEYISAINGNWNVLLTPSKYVPHNWFPELNGKKLLGLASGGGQQMPIFCALGAICTVLDYSDRQLESEKIIAEKEKYKINIVKADMTERLPFSDNKYDIIFNPVSNCFVENIYHIWDECYRVLNSGGILLTGFDNGMNYIFEEEGDDFKEPLTVVNKLPYNPIKNKSLLDENNILESGYQFSHTLEEEIGGQLKAGFILKDLYEDTDKNGLLHDYNIPQYIATKAIKP